jgi:hypothetical protein
MSELPGTRHLTAKPPRTSGLTIAIWLFVAVEAIGIGYFLWTY